MTDQVAASDGLEQRLIAKLDHAEKEAWNALARYKFFMFGYWAAVWVGLRAIHGVARANPWRDLVMIARSRGYGPDAGSVESMEEPPEVPVPALLAAMAESEAA
jgi:hypothetical protein